MFLTLVSPDEAPANPSESILEPLSTHETVVDNSARRRLLNDSQRLRCEKRRTPGDSYCLRESGPELVYVHMTSTNSGLIHYSSMLPSWFRRVWVVLGNIQVVNQFGQQINLFVGLEKACQPGEL